MHRVFEYICLEISDPYYYWILLATMKSILIPLGPTRIILHCINLTVHSNNCTMRRYATVRLISMNQKYYSGGRTTNRGALYSREYSTEETWFLTTFLKHRLFWYKIFENIVALFITLLLTPLEQKLIDYSLHNWFLKFLQKSIFEPFCSKINQYWLWS